MPLLKVFFVFWSLFLRVEISGETVGKLGHASGSYWLEEGGGIWRKGRFWGSKGKCSGFWVGVWEV